MSKIFAQTSLLTRYGSEKKNLQPAEFRKLSTVIAISQKG